MYKKEFRVATLLYKLRLKMFNTTTQSSRFEKKTTNFIEKVKKLGKVVEEGKDEKGYTNYYNVKRDKKDDSVKIGIQAGLVTALKKAFGNDVLDGFDMTHRPDYFALVLDGNTYILTIIECKFLKYKRAKSQAEEQMSKGDFHKYFYEQLVDYLQKRTGRQIKLNYQMMLSNRFNIATVGKDYLRDRGIGFKIGSQKPSLRDLGLRK